MTDETPSTDTAEESLDAAVQRTAVRKRYARLATGSSECCSDTGSSSNTPSERATKLGYSTDALDDVAPGANLGLGCGNPTGIASLEEGDTVLDLGSGAGFDCFLASTEVGPAGRVIGVDMTPEMVAKARENIDSEGTTSVEFRLGEIEHLPVANGIVDVIISNCVINLSPDKQQVFREAHRVLRPGGRLAISDIVVTAELPAEFRIDPTSVTACIGGASAIPELETMLAEEGFTDIAIEPNGDSEEVIREWDDEHDLSDYTVAATITGRKPVVE